MLTRKQKELLCFITDFIADNGYAPSFEEMKIGVGVESKSGIHRLVTALEERGFVKRLYHRARSIEVCRKPDGAPAFHRNNSLLHSNIQLRADNAALQRRVEKLETMMGFRGD